VFVKGSESSEMNSPIERTKEYVDRLVEYWRFGLSPHDDDTSEEIALEEVFVTKHGRVLGANAHRTLQFALKGVAMTQISVIVGLGPRFFERIAEGGLREAAESEGEDLEPKDNDIIRALETIAQHYPDSEEAEEDDPRLLDPEDSLWYFSLVAFALYAYLDVYLKNLIDVVASHKDSCQRIEQFLKVNRDEEVGIPDSEPMTVAGLKQRSLKYRLFCLVEGLGLSEILKDVLSEEELKKYWSAYEAFLTIRHKVAHSNPRLETERYTFPEMETDLEEYKFIVENIDELDVKSKFVADIIGDFIEELPDVFSVLNRLMLVVKMATFYPALVDCALAAATPHLQ